MDSQYFTPQSVADAVKLASGGGARLLAGGTDVYPMLGGAPMRGRTIDLTRIPALDGIELRANAVHIGARTTWTSLIKADLPLCSDGLKAAAREVGSRQIQNRASIGGNLCNASPAADGVPPLLALDAVVELASLEGTRRLPLADFILGNRRSALRAGEIMTAITVPLPGPRAASVFRKLGSRSYLVISIAMVAVTLVADDGGRIAQARVAIGACSPVAKRLPALEAALKGARIGPGLGKIAQPGHLAPLSPIDDVRATAAYRMGAARHLIVRALDDCAARLFA